MKDVVEAWGRGDLAPFYAALDNDVVWISASPVWDDRIRSGGTHRGRASVVALLSKISTAYFNLSCNAREITSQGETVSGIFDIEGIYRPVEGGPAVVPKPLKSEIRFRWQIRDGKIVHAQTYFDIAALLAQQGAPSAPA